MTTLFALQRMFSSGLLTIGRQWRRQVDDALSAHGLSEALASPLVQISRLGGGVRQVALANTLGIEGPSLVRLLDQLEKQELVVRKDDPEDRRAKGLWLTDAGQILAERIEREIDALRANVLRDIQRSDLEAALRVLKAFEQAAQPTAPKDTDKA